MNSKSLQSALPFRLLPWRLAARRAHADHVHVEARHTHPIGLSPGGDLLLASNRAVRGSLAATF